jgi:hypothetical protein
MTSPKLNLARMGELLLGLWTVRLTSKAVLDKVKALAIDRWGEDRWISELVRVYAKLDGTTPVKRRSQIARAFDVGGCTLETAILLLESVGCKLVIEQTVRSTQQNLDLDGKFSPTVEALESPPVTSSNLPDRDLTATELRQLVESNARAIEANGVQIAVNRTQIAQTQQDIQQLSRIMQDGFEKL